MVSPELVVMVSPELVVSPELDKLAKKLYPMQWVVLLSLLSSFLTGCVTTGRNSGWPIETYVNSCNTTMIPFEPSCLSWSDYDGGFEYKGQFIACKQSMLNFTNALDEYFRCSDEKLKDIFDRLLTSVPATYNCYVSYFNNKKEGDPISECPPVEVPHFYHSYEANGLEINLGVPRCTAKSDGYNFAPKRAYQVDDCREQVEVFMGKASLSHSLNATSAQDQYNTYLRNLRWVLDQKANDAVSKFNCIAEGRKYCM